MNISSDFKKTTKSSVFSTEISLGKIIMIACVNLKIYSLMP